LTVTASPGPGPKLPAALRYAVVGLLLSMGAPAGLLIFRMLQGVPAAGRELAEHGAFYLYTLLATGAVFAGFGFLLGRRTDRLQKSRDLYEDLATRDGLTHLLNARSFERHYARALEQARRSRQPISLLLLDVDHLKEINDRHGHSVGNEALLRVAGALESCKRPGDLACRWGGDEFAILMPGAPEGAAVRLAESILQRLGAASSGPAETEVTVTIGVASEGAAGARRTDLFELADRALYSGKQAGRAQLRVARGALATEPLA
jgi:diguanylate cyclase (GGDEF)-like protein